jgi:hypothetical protein
VPGSEQKDLDAQISDIGSTIAELAFIAWSAGQDKNASDDRSIFDRVYVGHYASIDGYADHLVDAYQLDAKLDAAIKPPFRAHVDIDVPGLARALRESGVVFALPAEPVGVWVFRTDPDADELARA